VLTPQISSRSLAFGMFPGVSLRRLIAEIRDFQDRQDCGVLTDAAEVNLAGQPLPDLSAAHLASSRLTTSSCKGSYRLRS
jgi:hypothetical protein